PLTASTNTHPLSLHDALSILIVPASLMVAGYIRHDSYQVSTALLAGEAYADSAVVDLAIKAITRRKRPTDVAPGGSFNDTFFSGDRKSKLLNSSHVRISFPFF